MKIFSACALVTLLVSVSVGPTKVMAIVPHDNVNDKGEIVPTEIMIASDAEELPDPDSYGIDKEGSDPGGISLRGAVFSAWGPGGPTPPACQLERKFCDANNYCCADHKCVSMNPNEPNGSYWCMPQYRLECRPEDNVCDQNPDKMHYPLRCCYPMVCDLFSYCNPPLWCFTFIWFVPVRTHC